MANNPSEVAKGVKGEKGVLAGSARLGRSWYFLMWGFATLGAEGAEGGYPLLTLTAFGPSHGVACHPFYPRGLSCVMESWFFRGAVECNTQ